MKTLLKTMIFFSFLAGVFSCNEEILPSKIQEPSVKVLNNQTANARGIIAPPIPQNFVCRTCKIYNSSYTVNFSIGSNSNFMNAFNDRIACILYNGALTNIQSGSWHQYFTLSSLHTSNPTFFDEQINTYYDSQTPVILNLAQIDALAQGFIATIKQRDLHIGVNQKFRCIKINQIDAGCCDDVFVFYDYTYGTI